MSSIRPLLITYEPYREQGQSQTCQKTAAELMSELEADPDYVAGRDERERERLPKEGTLLDHRHRSEQRRHAQSHQSNNAAGSAGGFTMGSRSWAPVVVTLFTGPIA